MMRTQMWVSAVIFAAVMMVSFPTAAFSKGIKLQAGAGLGYEVPAGDYAGTTVDYYDGVKYGLSGGINFHAKARAGAAGFQLAADIGYSSFSNSGHAEASGQGEVEVSQKIISIKLGPEYMISIPAVPLTPYVGANLALNTISGQTKFNGVSAVPSGTHDVKSTARFGLGLNGGVVYKIGPLMSLDLGVSYDMMNLFGKKYVVTDPTNPGRIDSYVQLNDDKDPVAVDGSDHIIGAARSISAMQVALSLMFGI
jgi:opacity protein-like surface antigen